VTLQSRSLESAQLPSLPLSSWAATKDTVHLWVQIVGKIKLAYAPPRNHWWHVTLQPGLRGLTTGRVTVDERTRFEISFDFVEHVLSIATNSGAEERLHLHDGLSVAVFDRTIHEVLDHLGMDVPIVERPYGISITTPFANDHEHASYDPDAVTRYWRILDWSAGVFEEFSGWFCGKTSPVQLYWHSLDLAFSRFNGRRAPARPEADFVTQEAYSHEVIAFGFWPGDDRIAEPSYYSYTAPEPPGLRMRPLAAPARWTDTNGGAMALLPYEAVRAASRPDQMLRSFLQSAYMAGATAAGWDVADLESSWCPPPDVLSRLTSQEDG